MWGGLLGAGLAYEVYAIHDEAEGDTLSEITRAVFRVHTRPGRAVFGAVWAGFAGWFFLHILTTVSGEPEDN